MQPRYPTPISPASEKWSTPSSPPPRDAFFAAAPVRIGAYDVGEQDVNWLRQEPNAWNLSAYVSARDLNQLLVRRVEVADVQFAIVHGISDNRFKRLDTTSTRDLLGLAPQDDAFDIFAGHLRDWLRD